MPSMMEHLQAINSFLRTLLALVVVGGVGGAGYYGYWTYTSAERTSQQQEQQLQDAQRALRDKDQLLAASRQEMEQQAAAISDLNRALEEKKLEIQKLETSLRLHKMERRLARITVLDTGIDSESKKTFSKIEFVELNSQGDAISDPRQYRIEGDLVYVDYWVAKFEDKYVEAADLERGTSICLFNRVFGEFQKPNEGFQIEEPGKRPGPRVHSTVMSAFEKKIWDDFWSIANSPQQAAALGIRALHGDAVSIKVQKGKTYRITVRASGGPEIEPEDKAPPPAPPTPLMLWQPSQAPRLAWPSWEPVRRPPAEAVAENL